MNLHQFALALRLGTIAGCLAMLPSAAIAQSGPRSGTITRIYLSGGYNYGFRISLSQGPIDQLSDCAASFAYMNVNNDNYQALSAFLLTRYAEHQLVAVNLIKDNLGFCALQEAYDP